MTLMALIFADFLNQIGANQPSQLHLRSISLIDSIGDEEMNYPHSELTGAIIQAFYQVYNTLGYGFLEKVYENALMFELCSRGFMVEQQEPINVYYRGNIVGSYFADLLVNHQVILELKCAPDIVAEHKAQLTNYLKATGIKVGLILNFGPKPQISRRVFDTARANLESD